MHLHPQLQRFLLIFYHGSKLIIKLTILDQISKWWVIGYLKDQPYLTKRITSFFDMVYTWNYGISFGFFKQYYQYSNMLFTALNSIIIIYLWRILFKAQSVFSFLGYSLIVGGALSNVLDRIFRGAVFDFIYLHYGEYGFAIFNLADAFISIGVLFIIIDMYKQKKHIAEQQNPAYDELEREAEKIRKADD